MLIDITKNFDTSVEIYPGDPEFKLNKFCTHEKDGYEVSEISFGSHFSTHIDSPKHFYPDGKNISDFGIDRFYTKVLVLTPSEKNISKAYMETILTEYNKNDFSSILFRSSLNNSFLSDEAAEYICSKNIFLIGTELDDIETGKDFSVHKILLKKEILILENIDLKNAPDGIYTLSCFPLKINCDASPVRAVLIK